jgi:hypothetical protein
MIEEAKKLKKGEVTFRRKQDVLLVTHQDKRLLNMISTLHTAAVVDDLSRHTGVTKENPVVAQSFDMGMGAVPLMVRLKNNVRNRSWKNMKLLSG